MGACKTQGKLKECPGRNPWLLRVPHYPYEHATRAQSPATGLRPLFGHEAARVSYWAIGYKSPRIVHRTVNPDWIGGRPVCRPLAAPDVKGSRLAAGTSEGRGRVLTARPASCGAAEAPAPAPGRRLPSTADCRALAARCACD